MTRAQHLAAAEAVGCIVRDILNGAMDDPGNVKYLAQAAGHHANCYLDCRHCNTNGYVCDGFGLRDCQTCNGQGWRP